MRRLPGPAPLRVGVFVDVVFRVDGTGVYTDRSFVLFLTGLTQPLGELVFFGRRDPETTTSHYRLPAERVRFVPLPHYTRIRAIRQLLRSLRRAKAAFESELDRLDCVWLFGPHPVALMFTWSAWRRGVPVVLGVRQDFPKYVRGRLPSGWWFWSVGAAHLLEASSRLLARRLPTVVVGEDLGRRYRRKNSRVLVTGFSLIRDADVISVQRALEKPWTSELRILTVGRLDPEKNPLLLPEILRRLRTRDARWRMTVVGEGVLEQAVRERSSELGVQESLELLGYVPSGAALWECYRSSHVFLHVSTTEGLPQVLFEAQAAGIPIVATDVGGVSAALQHGAAGLLIQPNSVEPAALALERVRDDAELRRLLIETAHANVMGETTERHLATIASFLADAVATFER
jgi:glycosyltransferase involved in cell wall biosynthesis